MYGHRINSPSSSPLPPCCLFVHQSFPSQYRHIIRALAKQGHQVVGLGIEPLSEPIPDGATYIRYSLTRGTGADVHPWVAETETKVIRGEACARAAHSLAMQGFCPDLICAHPGWGEALLRDIWPNVPLLCYQEYYYNTNGFDYGFDEELKESLDWEACGKLRMKNANSLLMLQASNWNITPTQFQKSTFPVNYHSNFSVIHDGIDTKLASPDNSVSRLSLPNGLHLSSNDQIITFVNRRIEPYRGCLTFMRSIPAIQNSCPQAQIVVVGGKDGVSYGSPPPKGNWVEISLAQIKVNMIPLEFIL